MIKWADLKFPPLNLWTVWGRAHYKEGVLIRKNNIESPCIKLCNYSYEMDKCGSCGRNLKEIIHWTDYTDEERKQIIDRLNRRTK